MVVGEDEGERVLVSEGVDELDAALNLAQVLEDGELRLDVIEEALLVDLSKEHLLEAYQGPHEVGLDIAHSPGQVDRADHPSGDELAVLVAFGEALPQLSDLFFVVKREGP